MLRTGSGSYSRVRSPRYIELAQNNILYSSQLLADIPTRDGTAASRLAVFISTSDGCSVAVTYRPTDMKPPLVARRRKGARLPFASELRPTRRVADALLLLPRPTPAVVQGDCFIVINRQGKCWNGEDWTDSWCDAIQFRRPDPAYELCEAAAHEAAEFTGVAGMVCYIPPGTPASFVLSPIPDLSQVDLRDFSLKPEER